MPEENVELSRRATEAFNGHDLAALLALLDPEIVFTPFEVALAGGDPFHGHDGVREWLDETWAVFPDLRAELRDVEALRAMVVASGRLAGAGLESGAAFDRPMAMAQEWRGGLCVWWHAYESHAEALAAAKQRAAGA
jgi:ketosteroid isomerase-like protein